MNRYGTALASTSRWIASGERYGTASFDRLLTGFALAAFLVTAASFLGSAAWVLELLTHFRFQVAAGSAVLLVCALARRRLIVAALSALSAAANAAPLVPYVLAGPAAAEAAAQPIRLMAANVHYRNFGYAALLEQIREQDPDVLGLLEVDQAWLDELSALEKEFRWTVLRPEEGAYGLALYSKLPLRRLPGSPYVEGGLQTAIAVELEMNQVPVTLALAHVRAPTSRAKAELRNLQFEVLAEMLRPEGNEARILLGDLNTTPWSPYYRKLASATETKNAAVGRGYQPTWPAGFSLLKIPIDHCLLSDALRVRDFHTGADFGSDHLPIIIDLVMSEYPLVSDGAR